MNNLVPGILSLFGFLSLFSQILLLLLIAIPVIYYFSGKKTFKKQIKFLSENALSFAFLVSVLATVGSLFLSFIAKIPPCDLCWYQRILMFPQALILGIAFFVNDAGVRKYIIPLSGIGGLIAVYHYSLQMFGFNLNLPCSSAISCSTKQLVYFGYLTIPMMSLTAFLFMLYFALLIPSKKK